MSVMRARSSALPWLLSLCSGLTSCERAEAPVFHVELGVRADFDEPVPGARLWVAGEAAGESDAAGRLALMLRGHEGDRLKLRLECPSGFRAEPEQSLLILRDVRPLNGRDGHESRALTQALRCKPTQRQAVVLVHVAGAERVPVRVDGAPASTTNAHGFAHVYVSRDPGARLEVMLDTSAQRELMPQNPRRTFEIADADALFVFDQSFRSHPPHLPRARPAPPPPPLPVRLR